jgi:hypothetical protein
VEWTLESLHCYYTRGENRTNRLSPAGGGRPFLIAFSAGRISIVDMDAPSSSMPKASVAVAAPSTLVSANCQDSLKASPDQSHNAAEVEVQAKIQSVERKYCIETKVQFGSSFVQYDALIYSFDHPAAAHSECTHRSVGRQIRQQAFLMRGKLPLMVISDVADAEGTRPRLCLGTIQGHRGTERGRTKMARRLDHPCLVALFSIDFVSMAVTYGGAVECGSHNASSGSTPRSIPSPQKAKLSPGPVLQRSCIWSSLFLVGPTVVLPESSLFSKQDSLTGDIADQISISSCASTRRPP